MAQEASGDWLPFYEKAIHLESEGYLDEARTLYERALLDDPVNLAVLWRLGTLLHKQRRWSEAVEVFEKATSLDATVASAFSSLGRALLKDNRLSEAIAAFRKCISIEPSAVGYCLLADALWDEGKIAEAEESLREATKLEPEFDEPHFNLGVLLSQERRPSEAEPYLRRACQLCPDHAPAHRELGLCYFGLHRFDLAEQEVRIALEIDPKDGWSTLYLGTVLSQLGRAAEAESWLRKSLVFLDELALSYKFLAEAVSDLPWRSKDVEHFLRKAIALEPMNLKTRLNLILHLAKHEKRTEAESEISFILQSPSCDPALRDAVEKIRKEL